MLHVRLFSFADASYNKLFLSKINAVSFGPVFGFCRHQRPAWNNQFYYLKIVSFDEKVP
jgi:hypothetical protein